jgi:hypothetical protein
MRYDLKPLDITPTCFNPFGTKHINRRDNIKINFGGMIPHFSFPYGKCSVRNLDYVEG